MLTREQKILRHINKSGLGIEIGPSHNPITPKSSGYNVHIIDYLSQEGLVEKYRSHNIDLNKIEHVDFVWEGQSYSELTGKRKNYDWIIGAHVIEHTPDFIGFLLNCDEVLNDTGVLSLVIPDKRFCFDCYRPISGIAHIIDNFHNGNKIHSPGVVVDYFLNVARKSNELAWAPDLNGECEFIHTIKETIDHMNRVINSKEFMDVHSWVFTPHSFRLLIHDLNLIGLIPFKELDFFDNENGFEFYISISRNGKGPQLTRKQ